MGLILLFALIIATCAAMILGCVELAIRGVLLFLLLLVAVGLSLIFVASAIAIFGKGDNDGNSTNGSSK